MSRSQQNQVFNQEQGENANYSANAQTSYNAANAAENNFESQLAKTSAANPYVQGGEFQTAENQELANTADAGAQSAGNALQSAAVRTGQNPGGAIAATEAMSEQNTRNLGAEEGAATQSRIGSEAGYNTTMLNAAEQPASFEAQLAGQQGQLAQGAAGTQEQAAQTPSFMDQLTGELIGAGSTLGSAAIKAGCWIAAELFDGWSDPRTILVREWLWLEFSKGWLGRILLRAYLRYGERIAARIRTEPWLRTIMQVVFGAALRKAEKWVNSSDRGR